MKESIIIDNKFKRYKYVLWIYEPYNYNFNNLNLDIDEYMEMEQIILEHMPEIAKMKKVYKCNWYGCVSDSDSDCDDNDEKEEKCIDYNYVLSINQSIKLLTLLDPKYHKYLKIIELRKYSNIIVFYNLNRVIKVKLFPITISYDCATCKENNDFVIPYHASKIYMTTFK